MNTTSILLFEWNHFVKNKFKIIALTLFTICSFYSLNNGYQLYKTQKAAIKDIKSESVKNNQKILDYFNKNQKGPQERPWIDLTTPFWAVYFANKTTIKNPSPLLPFSIGQTEQYAYYKSIATSSTTYDADLVEEIANPERLGIGSLDFSFTLLFLLPILLIILLFNVGGLESDFEFIKLIKIQHGNTTYWLLKRYLFYYLLTLIIVFSAMFLFAFLTSCWTSTAFYELLFWTTVYCSIWFIVFFFINVSMQNSQINAIKMISIWLLFCVLIPSLVGQYSSLKYPTNYMTSFIDSNRDVAYKMYDLSKDKIKQTILDKFPELKNSVSGKLTTNDNDVLDNSLVVLIAEINNKAIKEIERKNEEKNTFIKKTYLVNPVTFFQNKFNQKSNSDYYAFLKFRNQIDVEIAKKQKQLLFDDWNKVKVNKEKYIEYLKN
jgi:ABC-2 type transport system permease protein